MKKVRKYFINCTYIVVLMISFFGCNGGYVYYYMHIENETQDDLRISIKNKENNLNVDRTILSGVDFSYTIAENKSDNNVTKAGEYINNISVFTLDDIPLIYLSGAKIDEKVIYTGKRQYRVFFRFEIKEEDFGLGIDKSSNLDELAENQNDINAE